MPGTYSMVYQPDSDGSLTSSQYIAEHQNHINNMDPDGVGDASASATEMRATADPYPASAESLATDLRGEIERLRYVVSQLNGETYWYQDPVSSVKFAALLGLIGG